MKLQEFAPGEAAVDPVDARAAETELGRLLKQISQSVENDRRRAVASLFKVADRYEVLRSSLSASRLRTFLADVCNIPQAQAKGYAALLPTLAHERETLIRHGVSPDVVLRLAVEREDVREEVLRMIKSGRTVQTREFAAVRRDLDHIRLRQDGAMDPRRRTALARFVAKRARQEAGQLVRDVESFARRLLTWIEIPSFNPFLAPYKERLEADGVEAEALLERMRSLLPEGHLTSMDDIWIWEHALSALRSISGGQVSEDRLWDQDEDLEHFAPEDCCEISYSESLIKDLARAAGFIIDPQDPREMDTLRKTERKILSDEHAIDVSEKPTVLELCAGGGGQAIGLHAAGFRHVGLIEWKAEACATISLNRPDWPVINADLRDVDYTPFRGVDLLAGGVPCQPFSNGGRRKGRGDERDMFDETLGIIQAVRPRAIMLENVMGLFEAKHLSYRLHILGTLSRLGYDAEWREIQGPHFGMAQRRRRTILIAMRKGSIHRFRWPEPLETAPKTVGETLVDLMSAGGWKNAESWARIANGHCMTIVGGSDRKKNCDMAMRNSRRQWYEQAINPHSVAMEAPGPDAGPVCEPGNAGARHQYPRLTLRMVARLQGFPDEWKFAPSPSWKKKKGFDSRGDMPKASASTIFPQIANAFPSPLARVLGIRIKRALNGHGTDLAHALSKPYDIALPKFDMRNLARQDRR